MSTPFSKIEIEPLSDEAIEMMAGGKSSEGPVCCSCQACSGTPDPDPDAPSDREASGSLRISIS